MCCAVRGEVWCMHDTRERTLKWTPPPDNGGGETLTSQIRGKNRLKNSLILINDNSSFLPLTL